MTGNPVFLCFKKQDRHLLRHVLTLCRTVITSLTKAPAIPAAPFPVVGRSRGQKKADLTARFLITLRSALFNLNNLQRVHLPASQFIQFTVHLLEELNQNVEHLYACTRR